MASKYRKARSGAKKSTLFQKCSESPRMTAGDQQLALGLLDELAAETDRLDQLMDQMITEMENTPPDKRSGEAWDAFTERFLELQAAQQDIGEKVRLAKAALAQLDAKSTKQ